MSCYIYAKKEFVVPRYWLSYACCSVRMTLSEFESEDRNGPPGAGRGGSTLFGPHLLRLSGCGIKRVACIISATREREYVGALLNNTAVKQWYTRNEININNACSNCSRKLIQNGSKLAGPLKTTTDSEFHTRL